MELCKTLLIAAEELAATAPSLQLSCVELQAQLQDADASGIVLQTQIERLQNELTSAQLSGQSTSTKLQGKVAELQNAVLLQGKAVVEEKQAGQDAAAVLQRQIEQLRIDLDAERQQAEDVAAASSVKITTLDSEVMKLTRKLSRDSAAGQDSASEQRAQIEQLENELSTAQKKIAELHLCKTASTRLQSKLTQLQNDMTEEKKAGKDAAAAAAAQIGQLQAELADAQTAALGSSDLSAQLKKLSADLAAEKQAGQVTAAAKDVMVKEAERLSIQLRIQTEEHENAIRLLDSELVGYQFAAQEAAEAQDLEILRLTNLLDEHDDAGEHRATIVQLKGELAEQKSAAAALDVSRQVALSSKAALQDELARLSKKDQTHEYEYVSAIKRLESELAQFKGVHTDTLADLHQCRGAQIETKEAYVQKCQEILKLVSRIETLEADVPSRPWQVRTNLCMSCGTRCQYTPNFMHEATNKLEAELFRTGLSAACGNQVNRDRGVETQYLPNSQTRLLGNYWGVTPPVKSSPPLSPREGQLIKSTIELLESRLEGSQREVHHSPPSHFTDPRNDHRSRSPQRSMATRISVLEYDGMNTQPSSSILDSLCTKIDVSPPQSGLEAAFDQIDVNGDGVIDRAEWSSYSRNLTASQGSSHRALPSLSPRLSPRLAPRSSPGSRPGSHPNSPHMMPYTSPIEPPRLL